MDNNDIKILAIIEIPDSEDLLSFRCLINKRPSIRLNDDAIHMSTSTWTATQYKWENLEVNFYKENVKNWMGQKFLLKWQESVFDYYLVGGTNHSHKKSIFLKIIDPTGVVIERWKLKGAQIMELNINFSFYEKFKNIIVNNVFSRMVLFEKKGYETLSMNCDLVLSIDRAILEYE